MTVKRNKQGRPSEKEIALIKAMIGRYDKSEKSDQDILAYFSRPNRSLNHRVIIEIRNNEPYAAEISPASNDELDSFLSKWPAIDDETGLHIVEDELLLKAREAMMLAVQSFNNPQAYFRSEVFIVLSVIAWTYLLHAHYKKTGVDYRYYKTLEGKKVVEKTTNGAEKYWELEECLGKDICPLDENTKNNLKKLLIVRHEIEHRMTTAIDESFAAAFQACGLNFNREIKNLFGSRLGLDRKMSVALQFASFDTEQVKTLLSNNNLPPNLESAVRNFEESLTSEEKTHENFVCRVVFKRVVVGKVGQADKIVEFTKVPLGAEIKHENVYLQEVEKKKYWRKNIIMEMQNLGFVKFKGHQHTQLVNAMDARNTAKGYGVELNVGGWFWYESWLNAVRKHCEENRDKYT
jgi:hypothetical protein